MKLLRNNLQRNVELDIVEIEGPCDRPTDIINWVVSITTSAASCNEKHMRLISFKKQTEPDNIS